MTTVNADEVQVMESELYEFLPTLEVSDLEMIFGKMQVTVVYCGLLNSLITISIVSYKNKNFVLGNVSQFQSLLSFLWTLIFHARFSHYLHFLREVGHISHHCDFLALQMFFFHSPFLR